MEGHRVCPWWVGYFLASPIRRWFEDPAQIVAPYVRPGTTVVEPGPGMGFFTLELARRVGAPGRVVAVDIQQKMLDALRRRLAKAGLLERVEVRRARPDSMDLGHLAGRADFVLAYAVVHELPSAEGFFREAAEWLKPGGCMLLVEPGGHVKAPAFAEELALASRAGLKVAERPKMGRRHAAVLRRE
jgi:SAM-dependent methyltransferase